MFVYFTTYTCVYKQYMILLSIFKLLYKYCHISFYNLFFLLKVMFLRGLQKL